MDAHVPGYSRRQLFANAAMAFSRVVARLYFSPAFCESRTSAVREYICPAFTIVRDESPDGHGLHRVRSDADSSMADAGRGAEQDHPVLRVELRRRFCHG
jgi:hypothetical protein